MNISLKPEYEQFIQAQIQSGRYATVDEVIGAAFKLLEQKELDYTRWLEETRQKVAVGIEQINRGEVLDGEVVMAQLQEKLRKVNISR